MNIEHVSIDSISPDPANARLHSARNIEQIKSSLRRFGQQKPIVVDAANVVRAGNGTLAAARALGWATIAVVRSELPKTELTAYAIADNRSAELAEWDREVLAATLRDPEIGDVGFLNGEIEAIFDEHREEPAHVAEPMPERWMILVTCRDEAEQAEMLEKLEKDGVECRAMMA